MNQFWLFLIFIPLSLFGVSATYGIGLKIIFWGENPYRSALERFLRSLSASALISTLSAGAVAFMTISDPTIIAEALSAQPNSSETIGREVVTIYILMSYGAIFSYTQKKLSAF